MDLRHIHLTGGRFMQCPVCRHENPLSAPVCDCGYRFQKTAGAVAGTTKIRKGKGHGFFDGIIFFLLMEVLGLFCLLLGALDPRYLIWLGATVLAIIILWKRFRKAAREKSPYLSSDGHVRKTDPDRLSK
jgi:hypothetical protein